MAQAVCENPQMAIEEEVSRKFADLTVASAAANRSAAKASGDLKATGTAKEKYYDLSNDKENDDIANAEDNAVFDNAEKKNRIQVSNTKKPLFFYLNLAKLTTCSSLILFVAISLSNYCASNPEGFGSPREEGHVKKIGRPELPMREKILVSQLQEKSKKKQEQPDFYDSPSSSEYSTGSCILSTSTSKHVI